MKTSILFIAATCAGVAVSCAATVPHELASAREADRRVTAGPAAKTAPAELHVAHQALAKAEKAFAKDANSYQTRDLAYVAQRKFQLAEATAAIAIQKENQSRAKEDFETTQGQIVVSTKEELARTQGALATSETSGSATAAQLAVEKTARADAERRAATAQAALAKLAEVRDEPRGLVITLSGSVLFASNQATLLPAAQARLDQVADVLLATRERNVMVEGYTDSRGTESYNLNLSQRRADAVRSYLVGRSYEADLIQARGLGEGSPVGDNSNAEGRANNRRVEIIIEREALQTSSNR
jgi:outer membrane protein OmpA-like peptidoglycan-associated protein